MAETEIPARRRAVTATNVLNEVGDALDAVARSERLTNKDLGKLLGRQADAARLYRAGESEMGIVAWALATKEWGAAFADPLLNMLGYRLCLIDSEQAQPQETAAGVGRFLSELLTFLADGHLTHEEKLKLADTLLPLMPRLQGLLDEAAAIR